VRSVLGTTHILASVRTVARTKTSSLFISSRGIIGPRFGVRRRDRPEPSHPYVSHLQLTQERLEIGARICLQQDTAAEALKVDEVSGRTNDGTHLAQGIELVRAVRDRWAGCGRQADLVGDGF
jgi:hypothetical protein